MGWVIAGIVGWCIAASVLAAVIGRAIRVADERENEWMWSGDPR